MLKKKNHYYFQEFVNKIARDFKYNNLFFYLLSLLPNKRGKANICCFYLQLQIYVVFICNCKYMLFLFAIANICCFYLQLQIYVVFICDCKYMLFLFAIANICCFYLQLQIYVVFICNCKYMLFLFVIANICCFYL
jgi:hypothetical protein